MELGSNFDLNVNDLYLKPNNVMTYIANFDTCWFNYGRSAIKSINIPIGKKILLPEFICESVINCFPADNIVFFKVKPDLSIDFDDLFPKIDQNVGVVYICHYFGYLQDKEKLNLCRVLADQYNILMVEDTTQSFFSRQELIGDLAVASLRKWLPIPQGAVLCARGGDNNLNNLIDIPTKMSTDNTSVEGMILKNLFLNKKYETNKMYREIFADCEDMVDNQGKIEGLSEFTEFIIKCFDVESLVKKRKDNANRLKKHLDEIGIKNRAFSDIECPLVVPIRVRNRDVFRRYLMENNIYCAVHWPFDGFQAASRPMGQRNAEELISLPIDQRYGTSEIDYLCEVIDKNRTEL